MANVNNKQIISSLIFFWDSSKSWHYSVLYVYVNKGGMIMSIPQTIKIWKNLFDKNLDPSNNKLKKVH